MKTPKLILAIVTCIFFVSTIYAQTNTFPSSGNVGIGTVTRTPVSPLEVFSTTSSGLTLSTNSDGNDNSRIDLNYYIANTNQTPARISSYYSYTPYGAVGMLRFFTSDAFIGLFERMRITNNGYVGIGTTTPKAKIEILHGYNAYPATGGNSQGGAALRLRGSNNAVLDFGMYTTNTWIQATDQLNLGLNYNISLNPNGGNVGIGIGNTSPLAKLHVNSGQNNPYAAILATSSENNNLVVSSLNTNTINGEVFRISQEYFNSPSNRNNGYISFYRGDGVGNGFLAFGSNGLERLRINPSGNISIGTTVTDPTALLTVNGTIHAKEINVTVDIPADYVFQPTYKLMPLHEVEQFVKTNSHLPEIPSAAEVQKNGLSIGEMQNKLLQKIEELTLYVIDLQKTNESQSAEIEELKRK